MMTAAFASVLNRTAETRGRSGACTAPDATSSSHISSYPYWTSTTGSSSALLCVKRTAIHAQNAVTAQRLHNGVLRLESDAAGASNALHLGSGTGDADLGADVASAQTRSSQARIVPFRRPSRSAWRVSRSRSAESWRKRWEPSSPPCLTAGRMGGTHYVALYAVYEARGKLRVPLLGLSPLEDGTQTADAHIKLFENILDVYNKTNDMVGSMVGDNCATNQSIATKMGIPLVGCASHRFNLTVNKFLEPYGDLLDEVNNLMVELRRENNRAELKQYTDLTPIKGNVTRWSSTFTMVQRYIRIRAEIKKVDAVEEMVPTGGKHRKLVALFEHLKKFESICKQLQREDTSMREVRVMFDAVIAYYPVMSEHLKSTAKIVHTPAFETVVVKVLAGSVLSSAEIAALKRFEQTQSIGKKRKEREEDYATVLLQGKGKRKHEARIATYMPLVKMVPPTSNTVERLFSQCKLVLTPQRRSMLPANFEQLTFLRLPNQNAITSSTSCLLSWLAAVPLCKRTYAEKKNKRFRQIAALAAAKRSCDRPARDQASQPTTHVPLAALRLEAQSTHWCCPTLVVEEHETSSEDDTSDFGEGPNLLAVDVIYAKKTNPASDAYYFVGWVGYAELTWQPAADLPQDLINEFERDELGPGVHGSASKYGYLPSRWSDPPVRHTASQPSMSNSGAGNGDHVFWA
ncbi:hypothetical protein ON010_g8451 [Phytophthora cinnamomi]|nr:hypothetical protein ON010_g8451 [Phytophthora cinnamomi]